MIVMADSEHSGERDKPPGSRFVGEKKANVGLRPVRRCPLLNVGHAEGIPSFGSLTSFAHLRGAVERRALMPDNKRGPLTCCLM